MDQIEEMLEYFPAMPSPMPSSPPEYPEGSDSLPEGTVLPESSVPPSLTLVLTPYILFMSFTITLLVLLQIFRFFQIGCYSEQRRNERTDSSSPRQQWYSWELDTFVVSLDIQDRVELYRRAFERNQHRHTLKDENFCPTEIPSESETANKTNETVDRQLSEMEDQSNVAAIENHGSNEQDENENENSPWIYLRLMKRSVTEQKLALTDGGEDDKDNDINRNSDSSSSNNDNDNNSNNDSDGDGTLTKSCKTNEIVPRTKIPGNCIICFEDFCVGDTVVWSEDPTICKHVYHENCLAQFLATHSYQIDPYTNTHGSYSENPCPTCRHPFCTITQEDLVQSILLKSIEMANKNRSD